MTSSAAQVRDRVLSTLGERWDAAFIAKKPPAEIITSVVGDVPRGALTEIAGPASSGRTSLLYSLLAAVSCGNEFCALVDATDAFDPASATDAGVRLSQVLWVRCGGNVENALKAVDLLVQSGGFGLVAVDLGDTPIKTVHRIPLASWFRLRQAVENTKTILLVVAQKLHTHSCSALKVELEAGQPVWRGSLPGCLLDGLQALGQTLRHHRRHIQQFTIAR